MPHIIDLTNNYHTTIYDQARMLLNTGIAKLSDTIAIQRNGKLSMQGYVGTLAKWTVRQNASGLPSMELVRWKPFSPWIGRTAE